MASLEKKSNGVFMLRWYDEKRIPTRISESLKTSNKQEATRRKSELETKYWAGEHNPWKKKWYDLAPEIAAENTMRFYIHRYLMELEENDAADYAEATIMGKKVTLKLFASFLDKKNIEWFEVTDRDVQAFLKHQNYTPAAAASRFTMIRAFLNHAYKKGWLMDRIELKAPAVPKSLPVWLSDVELQRIEDSIRSQQERVRKFQQSKDANHLWMIDAMWFAARTGLRINELMQIKTSHIVNGNILVGADFRTKNKSQRMIPLMDKAATIAQTYLDADVRANNAYLKHSAWLFGRKHGIMSTRLSETFIRVNKKVNGHYRKFHDLRHTFAVWYLTSPSDKNRDYRLFALKEMLGHASLETTGIYLKMNPESFKL
jgi:site-specific recombinase XerD